MNKFAIQKTMRVVDGQMAAFRNMPVSAEMKKSVEQMRELLQTKKANSLERVPAADVLQIAKLKK